MITKSKVTKPWTLVVAGLMVTIGSAVLIFWPWLTQVMFGMVLNLNNAPTIYLWRKNPMPLYLEFYLFNWTNPQDVYNESIKPHFQEIGPFVFEEIKEKVNISWNDNNTITFEQKHTYYFKEDMSAGNLSTKITTLNSVAASAAYLLRSWNFMLRKGFDWSLTAVSHKIHTTRTVGELIFFGHEDPLISIARSVPNFHGLTFPDWDKFAWFYTRNGTSHTDGVLNMIASGESFGKIKNWNYRNDMAVYQDICDKVRGSAGEFYGPNRKRDKIGFFSTDICRYIQLDYVRDEEIDGTLGYRYELGNGFFETGGDNACYCSGECAPYGSVNVSSCKFGAPGFVSSPHFYGADRYYLDTIDGMEPNEEKHQMFVTIEPTSGIPLKVAARFQLNILIEPIKFISMFQQLPKKLYIPVVWLQEKVKIPDNLHLFMRIFLKLPTIFKCTGAILLMCGVPLFTVLLYKPILSTLTWRTSRTKNIKITFNEINDCGLPLVNSAKVLTSNNSDNDIIIK